MSQNNSFDIVLTGVGGQGIVMLSNALGNACAHKGIVAVTGELHGLSQRSGTVYIHFRMGGEKRAPIIPYGEADAIVAMEAMEALRYIEFLKDDGIIIMNSRMVYSPVEVANLSKEKKTDFVSFDTVIENLKQITSNIAIFDALKLARDAGNERAENAVFIGALASLADLPLTVKDLKYGLETVVPKTAMEENIKAFENGYKTAFDTLCKLVSCREME